MEKSRVPALNRCLAILELLKERPLFISEAVTKTNMPRSTVYVVVEEMLKQGLIRQSRDGRLHLWMRLVDFGYSALNSFEYRDFLSSHFEGLIKMLDCQAVHFGVVDKGTGYYVLKKLAPNCAIDVPTVEGGQIDLVHSAMGRCLLAFTTDATRDAFFAKANLEGAAFDDFTVKLQSIRNRGFATDNEDFTKSRVIAVPLYMKDSEFFGTIEVIFDKEFYDEKLKDAVDVLTRCARNLTILITTKE